MNKCRVIEYVDMPFSSTPIGKEYPSAVEYILNTISEAIEMGF